jgi:hypothetical protein
MLHQSLNQCVSLIYDNMIKLLLFNNNYISIFIRGIRNDYYMLMVVIHIYMETNVKLSCYYVIR